MTVLTQRLETHIPVDLWRSVTGAVREMVHPNTDKRLRIIEGATPDCLDLSCHRLAARAADELPVAQRYYKDLFSGASVIDRAKSKSSIFVKAKARTLDDIGDLVGVRAVLKSGSQDEIDSVAQKLVDEIRAGRLKVFELGNYHGPDSPPYFNPKQVEAIVNAMEKQYPGAVVRQEANNEKKAGYHSFHIKGLVNGVKHELQIRGPKVHDVAVREQFLRIFRDGEGKELDRAMLGDVYDEMLELQRIYKGLTQKQRDDLDAYLAVTFKNAKAAETNPHAMLSAPELPKSLGEYSDVLNMKSLDDLYGRFLQSKAKQVIRISPQA